ncbi:hypothetical protein KBD59_02380 [Candidatus Gracilibacteria bacterium]|nr:hypothetical protein [Candidatus Gracilibacteria bacterium]
MPKLRESPVTPRVRPGRQGKRNVVTHNLVALKKQVQANTEDAVSNLHRAPQTRSECQDGIRPCPYVRCKYNLYLDVNPRTGSMQLNFPNREPWEMEESCALDVADRGGTILEEVGDIFNLTRERIRQVEAQGLEKLRKKAAQLGLRDFLAFLDEPSREIIQ